MENTEDTILTNSSWGYGVCDQCEETGMCPVCKEKDNAFMSETMGDFYAEEEAFYNEQKRTSERILKALESIKGSEWVEQLNKYAKDSECHHPFKVVKKPKGDLQECDYELFGDEWIDQHTGYECDDYYGTVTIRIDEKRYLEMPFHC